MAGVGASELSVCPSAPVFVTRDHHIIYIKHAITSCNLNSLIRCLVGVTSSNSTWSNPNRRLLCTTWLELKVFTFSVQTGASQVSILVSSFHLTQIMLIILAQRCELYNCLNDYMTSIETSAKSHYQVFEYDSGRDWVQVIRHY